MTEMNIIQEQLLMDDMVSGLCLIPDLKNQEAEAYNPMDLFRMCAIIPEQTHSCNVAVVDLYKRYYKDTDALITFERDVPVGVKTADCVPILIYAPDKHCVGAVHAGWKGTLGGIVDSVMDILVEKGVDPTKLKVAFGPSISKDVYEVSLELAERFNEAGFGEFISYPNGYREKPHIDLQGVNMKRFICRGVSPGNITLHDGCSFSSKRDDGSPMYCSHRRSGGAPSRMLTCIMMLSESEKARYRWT